MQLLRHWNSVYYTQKQNFHENIRSHVTVGLMLCVVVWSRQVITPKRWPV